ncbi:DNA-binding transcriptional regulator, MarR family [Granulicella rosea]|uniref:DNA-binding transcriptional regulator, MarR family n=1 Tax=Granulicella rosea TaxID=474952 RepID=A0A239LA96_9BACT|nr:MarR family transcriptional regulator [Granulicella rosea]SNT26464.1 DNA-binding transcriptional regulator, MarR family [Granulicella rosea]
MNTRRETSTNSDRLQALAEFRYVLRRFLHFSEKAAARVGVAPQQHQLLLQVAGRPAGEPATVGYLAERLSLRHHSVVELSDRCVEAGLLVREPDPRDRRAVLLRLTPEGLRMLEELSDDHTRELHELGPQMIEALGRLVR